MVRFVLFLALVCFHVQPSEPYAKAISCGKRKGFVDYFNIEQFRAELKKQNILYLDIVEQQARLETGHFTSRVFRQYNNFMGFRTDSSYLVFNTWKDCILYLAKYQQQYYYGGNYYSWIDRNYDAGRGDYVKVLKKISNEMPVQPMLCNLVKEKYKIRSQEKPCVADEIIPKGL